MSLRLFIVGAQGQVAQALREVAIGDPDLVIGYAARPELDLMRPETVAPIIDAFRPDVVINPAAYTNVDKAESEPDVAFAINRDGAAAVAAAAAAAGAPIIQLSTDYVFDGTKQAPYLETDPPAPQGVYGRSKLEGEAAVAAANPRQVILRTAWVYAPFGANFVRTMLRLAQDRDRLRVVDDQVGNPTYAVDLATGILAISRQIAGQAWRPHFAGVTHVAGPQAVSWCGFARQIMAGLAARGGKAAVVDAITTAEYPTPASRPANSRLSAERLKGVFGLEQPPLTASLDACLDRLVGPAHNFGD